MDHPIVYCAYSLPRMMPSEYMGLSWNTHGIWIYVYVHGIYPWVTQWCTARTALSQSTYSTVVYVAYPWVTQWCTARTALSQSTYSTVVYVAYPWVTQ